MPGSPEDAFTELTSGAFGRDSYEMLKRVARKAVRLRRYPPPTGEGWTDREIDELVHGFLAARDGPLRLVTAARAAGTAHGLELLVERMLKNHLSDLGRQTAEGKLHRRLRRVLSGDEGFIEVARDLWALSPALGAAPWAGRETDLLQATIERTPLDVVSELRRAGREDTGRVRATSLALVCHEVMEAAGAPLPLATLRAVVSQLIGLRSPEAVRLSESDVGEPLMTGAHGQPGPARSMAAELWRTLDDRERLLLPHLSDPVRRAAEAVGLGHSQAGVAMARLRARLRRYVEDDATARVVFARLLELQATWVHWREEIPDS